MPYQRNKPASIIVAVLVMLIVARSAFADQLPAVERVVWDKRPIAVHIQRNQERIIHFPDDVRYWLPDSLKRKVSVVAANGVLYIRATESFPATRIRVQGLIDQTIYLLDVTANYSESVSDELVVMKPEAVTNRAKDQTDTRKTEDWRVRLTRYAAQQFYAPERLLRGDSQIKRIPIDTHQSVSLVRGQRVKAHPIAAWQGGGFTITAIKLRNITEQNLHLVFDDGNKHNAIDLAYALRGSWLTAVTQHDFLGASGKETDTTTLYLVSDRPFIESLGVVLHPNDQVKEASDG
ncbi:TIGR03749 family integrating conjugative element protein [Alteromonas naphthalenivorans]|uniref:TIGR03749 family integrating conjugative element protein n=1 Tax=Alteromonas naphthalenivorans TaxID=715451 RepID=F5Z6Z4_ALTNA|nr:TIGR03749 family integrating conjugative element protein [Alteromonas naphthalenivorans]AEF05657.1 hypothetical protein ambt_20830 [Alteromonas naphthalenivorans]